MWLKCESRVATDPKNFGKHGKVMGFTEKCEEPGYRRKFRKKI